MNVLKLNVFLPLLFLAFPLLVVGQKSNGGIPPSYQDGNISASSKGAKILESKSNRYMMSQYGNVQPSKSEPLTFAFPINVQFSIANDGVWISNRQGEMVWVLSIKSPGALSLNLMFDKFVLPKSGRLFAYNPDKSFLLGSFTSANNRLDSLFAISPVPGDEIILEYTQDVDDVQKPIISINQVNHDFLGVFKLLNQKVASRFLTSGSCNVDVTADSNYSSIPQVRSECKILLGTELCSGTLLCNTSRDSSIYFLTAGHCLNTQAQASTMVFYYNYESPHGLKTVEGSYDLQTSGATLVANADTLDFALLKLTGERPSVHYRPYLSGWNRSVAPPAPYFAIHHPSGDVKKISRTINPLVGSTYNSPPFSNDIHWRVGVWNSGTTEGGSSGCGLFDNSGCLVGSLSGGGAFCGNSFDDYFVRFEKIWNYSPVNSGQLAYWLDPSSISSINAPFLGQELYGKQNAKRLSNIALLDSGIVRTSSPVRFKTGVYLNSPYSKVAEKFSNSTSKIIEGVYLVVGAKNSTTGRTVTLSFWSGVDSPEVLLHSMSNIPLSTLISNKEKFVKLDQSLFVNAGNLFVSYEINSPIAGDTLACYFSQRHKDGGARNQNSSYLYNGTNWVSFANAYPSDNGSLWLDIVTSDLLNNSLLSNKASRISLDVFPNPASQSLSIVFGNEILSVQSVRMISVDGEQYDIPHLVDISNGVSFAIPTGLKGIYIVQVLVGGEIVNKKVLVK